MRQVILSKSFQKDVKRLKKRNYEIGKLKTAMQSLTDTGKLDERYKDHPLRGNYQGCRECHLAPDWLLVYKISETELELARTGTHSDLFGK